MRVTSLSLAIVCTATIAFADDVEPPALLPPAPVDIAAFPPRLDQPELRPPGIEIHGFAATWWTAWSEGGPGAATDAFRLRFAVLRVDARPAPKVTVLARLGLMLPDSPLLDLQATYQAHRAIGVTFGQFRLPLGASATTLAPQLVMLDRPRYVYAMTKLAFRDVGAMVHSGPAGLLDGVLHYRVAVVGGSGRLGTQIARPPDAVEYLIAGRIMADLSRELGPRDRLVGGVSYAHSHDPAIDTGVMATDRALAANTLGRTLVPFGDPRITELAGADLTLSHGPVWVQGETMYLRSRSSDGTARTSASGSSVEAGYTLPVRPAKLGLQLAARGERFDPDRDLATDTQYIGALGLTVSSPRMRWSTFYSVTRFEDAATGHIDHAGELAFRAATTF